MLIKCSITEITRLVSIARFTHMNAHATIISIVFLLIQSDYPKYRETIAHTGVSINTRFIFSFARDTRQRARFNSFRSARLSCTKSLRVRDGRTGSARMCHANGLQVIQARRAGSRSVTVASLGIIVFGAFIIERQLTQGRVELMFSAYEK